MGDAQGSWREALDLSRLSSEDRYRLLEYVVGKVGKERVQEALGLTRYTIWRMLHRQVGIDDRKLRVILGFVSMQEFQEVLSARKLLEALGVVRPDGTVSYPVAVEFLKLASSDEYLKQLIIRFVVDNFREDVKKLLGVSIASIEFRWSPDFERWLLEEKSRPITQRTLKDYRSLFLGCLEGRRLSEDLLKVLKEKTIACSGGERSTGWLRQIARHYIQYLYSIGKLDWDTYTRLLMALPGRRYGQKLAQKPILTEDVVRTLETLEMKRPDIYTLYLVMLYSATRFEHTLEALKTWSPNEILYVPYLNRNITRLECLEKHCHYYLGRESDRKPSGFMFFPKDLLPLIERHRERLPKKRWNIELAVKKLGLLAPKYIRIYALREMKRVFGETDVWRFVASKFGELSVSARHYMDLLEEADNAYPRYIEHVKNILNSSPL